MKRASLLVSVLVGAACATDLDSDVYPIGRGTWSYAWELAVVNSCFPQGIPVPRGVGIDVSVQTENGEALVFTGLADVPAFPAMAGTQDDRGRFSASGETVMVVTTSCALGVSASVSGVGVAPDVAGADFEITFRLLDGMDCSAFENGTVDGFAFPTLADAGTSCTLAVKGLAARDDW